VLTVGLERPSGRRYLAIARELVRAGLAVRILTLHPDFAACPRRRLQIDGVDVWYVGQMHIRKTAGRIERFRGLRLLQVLLQSSFGLTVAVLRSPAALYHLGKPQPINGLAAWLALRLRGRRYLLDCDDDEAAANRFTAGWQRLAMQIAQALTVAGAAALTVNTTTLARRWQRPQRRAVIVPNGADPQLFTALSAPQQQALRRALGVEQAPLIVYAGTLALQSHAVDLLLAAFGLVQARLPTARLLVIGSGADEQLLRQMTAQQVWEKAVIWAGELTVRQTAALLSLADVSVDPVRDRAAECARAPLKLVESLMLGVPIVTSPVGDRGALLAAGGGLAVAPDDAAALADGLLQLLTDAALRTACRAAALTQRERWSWRQAVQPWLQLYRELGVLPADTDASVTE
jgi:glycosyltransferase involved in cell wall biosynthesis